MLAREFSSVIDVYKPDRSKPNSEVYELILKSERKHHLVGLTILSVVPVVDDCHDPAPQTYIQTKPGQFAIAMLA